MLSKIKVLLDMKLHIFIIAGDEIIPFIQG